MMFLSLIIFNFYSCSEETLKIRISNTYFLSGSFSACHIRAHYFRSTIKKTVFLRNLLTFILKAILFLYILQKHYICKKFLTILDLTNMVTLMKNIIY